MYPQLKHIVVLGTALAVLLIGVFKPAHNFDIVGYVAAIHYNQGLRGAALADRVYTEVTREIGEARLHKLMSGSYGETVYRDPVSLEQQVPFYAIRMGYLWALQALHATGASYAKATYLASALFQALSVLVLGGLASRAGVSCWAVPFVAFLTGYVGLAQTSSPDAMACLMALLATAQAARQGIWAYPLAVVLPLVRTDFVLFSAPLLLLLAYRGNRVLAIVSLGAAALCYLAANALNGNYGYLAIFQFTLIGLDPYPADMAISTRISDYLVAYIGLARGLAASSHISLYFVAAYVAAMRWQRLWKDADFQLLLLVPTAFLTAHLILFPVYSDRYFVYAASVILLWTLSQLQEPVPR